MVGSLGQARLKENLAIEHDVRFNNRYIIMQVTSQEQIAQINLTLWKAKRCWNMAPRCNACEQEDDD